MLIKALVQDRYCRSRYIAYFEHAVSVFYKHELKSLAELFGCLGSLLPRNLNLQQECTALTDLLCLESLNLPPPVSGAYFNNFSTPFRLAYSVALSSFGMLVLFSGTAHALPTGYQSVAGNVQFHQVGNTLNVSTQATHSIANYQTFNINQGETVNFNLPSAQSVILNRVVGTASPSEILGSMNSNGQVFITNPSGIIFGASAQVNVGALHATTLGISDQDFANGKYTFTQGSNPSASVTNDGIIQAQTGGYVVLSGGHIENAGNIYAPQGQVNLAVGSQITMTVDNNIAVSVTVDQSLKQAVQGVQDAITNTGTLSAQGGIIQAQANLEASVYNSIVNNQGVVEAQSFGNVNGQVAFIGNNGSNALVTNAGTIDVSGTSGSANGGSVSLNGDYVAQEGTVLANAAENGTAGHIELTSYKGSLLAAGSLTSAKGNANDSTGGNIRVWSNNNTFFDTGAVVDVSGGTVRGNAGYLELSGKNYLSLNGTLLGYANNGTGGQLLIDPANIIIQNGGGSSLDNLTSPQELFGNSPGATMTFDPTAAGQFFGHGFTDITLQATGNITVNSAFDTSMASYGDTAHAVSLSLIANNNITISAPVTTHNANITLEADNSGGNTGVLTITGTGSVTSNGGSVTLSGSQFLLAAGGTVNAGTGTVYIQPTTNKTINIGGTTDNNDSAGVLDISSPELSRITAGSLTIGSTSLSGDLNVSGNITLNATGAESFYLTLQNAGNISVNNNITTSGYSMEMITGNTGSIALASGTNINTGGGDLWWYSSQAHINGNINAGTGTVYISPISNGAITIGGLTDDYDATSGTLDISMPELSRITAATLEPRTTGGGDITTTGAISLPASGNGAYKLWLETQSGGNININNPITLTGHELELEGENFQSNVFINGALASGNAPIWIYGYGIHVNQSVNAGTSTVELSTYNNVNVGGTTDDADTVTVMDISIPEMMRVTASKLIISTPDGGGDLDVIGNVNLNASGAGAYDLELVQDYNNMNINHTINTNNHNLILEANENINITQALNAGNANITIAIPSNDYGYDGQIYVGGNIGVVPSYTVYVSQPTLNLLTASNVILGDGMEWETTQAVGNIDISSLPFNLTITNGGQIDTSGQTITLGSHSLTLLTDYDVLTTGVITGTNADITINSGDQVSITGAVTTTGTGNIQVTSYPNSNIHLGATIGGGEVTSIDAQGSGTIVQTAGTVLGANITLTSGSGNIGTSGTPILTGPGILTVNTGGNAWVNDAGNTTLAASSVGNNDTLQINANGSLTTSGAVTAGGNGLISLTTGSNGNIALGANVGSNTDTTLINANGSGSITQTAGTVLGSNITLTSGSGNIGTSVNKIQLGPSTLTANTTGSVYVNGTGNLTIAASSAGNNANFVTTGVGNITNTGAITGGTNTNIDLQADGNVTVNAGVTTVNGLITLYADHNGDNNGNLNIFHSVTSNNGNIALAGAQVDVDQLVSAGNGTISYAPSLSKAIQFGGSINDADTASTVDISAQELGNLSAKNVSLGDSSKTTSISLSNSLDVSGMPFGNLQLTTAGNYDSGGQTLNMGSKGLTITATNAINIDGGISSHSSIGLTTLTGDIDLSQAISGTTLNLNSGGSILNTGGYFQSNLVASQNAYLTANHYIGTVYNPLNVNIRGDLNLTITGELEGISGDLNGTANLYVLNQPPGLVIFNGMSENPGSMVILPYNTILRDKLSSQDIETRLLETYALGQNSDQFKLQSIALNPITIVERPRYVATDASVKQLPGSPPEEASEIIQNNEGDIIFKAANEPQTLNQRPDNAIQHS